MYGEREREREREREGERERKREKTQITNTRNERVASIALLMEIKCMMDRRS